MKKLLQYTRQLSLRRLNAFEFLQRESETAETDPVQLLLDYGHQEEVDARALWRKIADSEFDDE